MAVVRLVAISFEICSEGHRMIVDVGLPLFDADRKPIDSFELRRQSKQELEDRGVLPGVEGLSAVLTLHHSQCYCRMLISTTWSV